MYGAIKFLFWTAAILALGAYLSYHAVNVMLPAIRAEKEGRYLDEAIERHYEEIQNSP